MLLETWKRMCDIYDNDDDNGMCLMMIVAYFCSNEKGVLRVRYPRKYDRSIGHESKI